MILSSPLHYNDDGQVARFPYGISPSYKLDPETGLPEVLNEGEYFKVTGSCIEHWMQVHYMRKRTWWFDESLEYCIISAGAQDTVTGNDILWAALGAIEKWQARQEELALKAAAKKAPKPAKPVKPPKPVKVKPVDNSGWYGKYPPKSVKEGPNGG